MNGAASCQAHIENLSQALLAGQVFLPEYSEIIGVGIAQYGPNAPSMSYLR